MKAVVSRMVNLTERIIIIVLLCLLTQCKNYSEIGITK